jgi:plasmid stabilization system protein ParE
MERVIVWNKRPSKFLAKILRRISEDSQLQAERVEEAVLKAIAELVRNPERHPPDKFNKTNLGNCRAFELMSLRIAYKLTPTQIRVLRIRHVKQEPLDY